VTVNLPAPNQQILMDDALQGAWVATPSPLTKNAIESIQFQIVTGTPGPVPYDFCVSNMRVVK
jgi:hypothetical protein